MQNTTITPTSCEAQLSRLASCMVTSRTCRVEIAAILKSVERLISKTPSQFVADVRNQANLQVSRILQPQNMKSCAHSKLKSERVIELSPEQLGTWIPPVVDSQSSTMFEVFAIHQLVADPHSFKPKATRIHSRWDCRPCAAETYRLPSDLI